MLDIEFMFLGGLYTEMGDFKFRVSDSRVFQTTDINLEHVNMRKDWDMEVKLRCSSSRKSWNEECNGWTAPSPST